MNYPNQRQYSREISIETNQRCNLNCIYCYEQVRSDNVLDIERIKIILQEQLSKKTENGTLIHLHGGEPFLKFELIKQLSEWLWEQHFDESFIIHTTTNGTFVHGAIQKWLMKNHHRFFAKLSLDGNRLAHNINRNNSFDRIDINFFLKCWPNVALKMTISESSLPYLAESIIFLHKNGFQFIQAGLADFIDWKSTTNQRIFKEQFKVLNVFYLNHLELNRCKMYDIPFERLLDPDNLQWYQKKPCLTRTKIAYDINGREYPCHLFFPSVTQTGRYESIDFTSFNTDDLSSYVSQECIECQVRPLCKTCYGSNLICRGSIQARNMHLCSMEKIRIASVAKFEYERILNNCRTDEIDQNDYVKMLAISKIASWINKTLC